MDVQNPSNLGAESTDNGIVANLKWRFSDSKTRLLKGGWVREQVITDLPSSKDIPGAQQHLKKGATRELHWHKVAEWGFVYAGRVTVSAVDEDGKNQWEPSRSVTSGTFPKVRHTLFKDWQMRTSSCLSLMRPITMRLVRHSTWTTGSRTLRRISWPRTSVSVIHSICCAIAADQPRR